MIPCPHCEREFEKRAGLVRHVTVSHPHEPYTGAPREVPVNPGGAIEPVEPETYAESLDELAPGQEPYVDPDAWHERSAAIPEPYPHAYQDVSSLTPEQAAIAQGYGMISVPTPVRLTMEDGTELEAAVGRLVPTVEQYKQIRAFIRSGRSESEAWMNVVGYEPPPRPPRPVDDRPLRLQQVAFRVRNGGTDQIDARWLLQLAEIGADAIGVFEVLRKEADVGPSTDALIDRWKAVIQ